MFGQPAPKVIRAPVPPPPPARGPQFAVMLDFEDARTVIRALIDAQGAKR